MTEGALIGFASLFLGLTTGPQTVAVMVHEPVAAVRVSLDDRPVANLDAPPWEAEVDFGERLVPHRLDAVGLDASGTPLSRITQWVNVPREQAELEIAIERDRMGRAVGATFAWRAVRPLEPLSVIATLDGSELIVSDLRKVSFGPASVDEPHVLRAGVSFPNGMSASATTVFGGTYVDTTEAELTGVPLTARRRLRLPRPNELDGTFTVAGRAAPVAATERPAPRITVVLDERAAEALRAITVPPPDPRLAIRFNRWERVWVFRFRAGPGSGDGEIDILDTIPDQAVSGPRLSQNIFTCKYYEKVDLDDLPVLLARLPKRSVDPELQWLQAATASAGLAAARGSRPRIVVFILGTSKVDPYDYSPETVRGFLRDLHVPLRVWSPVPEVVAAPGPWGAVRDVSTLKGFLGACRDVVDEVERQFIAWVDGEYLPQSVAFQGTATDFALAR